MTTGEPQVPTTIARRGRRIEIGLDVSDAQELVFIIEAHDPEGKLGWRDLARSLQGWVDDQPTYDRGSSAPYVNGKRFICSCGCNVFKRTNNVYRCNACGTEFEGTPVS